MSTAATVAVGLAVLCVLGFVYGTINAYLNGLERAAECSAHVRQGPPSWDASTGRSLNVWDQCP